MKIGFFGDSFCAEMHNPHSLIKGYETYIKRLKKHYGAEIVSLGIGGSSYWDIVLEQFPKLEKNLPDVCIFCWTDNFRLYHKNIKNLTSGSLEKLVVKDTRWSHLVNYRIYLAGKKYFRHLHDNKKADMEYISCMYYFDNVVIPRHLDSTKIIHLWSFDRSTLYRWKHGVEVRPGINYVNRIDNDHSMIGANHLGSEEKNTIVFEWLKTAIDNYDQYFGKEDNLINFQFQS